MPTIGEQLANSRRIAGDNADLFAIADGALREVRELGVTLRADADNRQDGEGLGYIWSASKLEAITDRYDAAISDAIK